MTARDHALVGDVPAERPPGAYYRPSSVANNSLTRAHKPTSHRRPALSWLASGEEGVLDVLVHDFLLPYAGRRKGVADLHAPVGVDDVVELLEEHDHPDVVVGNVADGLQQRFPTAQCKCPRRAAGRGTRSLLRKRPVSRRSRRPGGTMNPDQLRTNPGDIAFLKAFVTNGKPIGAIRNGAWTLAEADLVRGLRLTSWPSHPHGPSQRRSRRRRRGSRDRPPLHLQPLPRRPPRILRSDRRMVTQTHQPQAA